MKRLILIVSILGICITSLGVINDRLEHAFLPKPSDVFVLNLPPEHNVKSPHESYTGPHPIEMIRAEDSVSFPIKYGDVGPHQPLFANKNDYPFLCGSERSGLGQPVADNNDKVGVTVYFEDELHKKTDEIRGYSKDCGLTTSVEYYVKDLKLNAFKRIAKKSEYKNTVSDFIRVETGTINRFIYVLAIPVSINDMPDKFDQDKWNNRLIYRFKGGVGVGRQQGSVNIPKLLYEHEPQLTQGYALAFSTGTQTSNHYDIWLSEDTALRVKRQFESRYGEPLYTIGIGGSGGAIQQYLLAQNHPGIIDAAIPLYSYPDMVTQVNYALDCELLEYYFDVTDGSDRWQDWNNRSLFEGSNALNDFKNKYGKLQGYAAMTRGDFSLLPRGASECTNGWRGPSQHINNPNFYSTYHAVSPDTFSKVDWSHWGNLRHFYGTDEHGFGLRFWGNEGVQYGLLSLQNNEISVEEFIQLNEKVGGWKSLSKMENERFWHISGDESFSRLSIWSHHNMTHSGSNQAAKRTVGSAQAIKASYQAGLVFLGLADLPIIDMRHYLDHKLDMHHSVASFTARKRIEAAVGHSDHHLIWMSEKNEKLSRLDLLQSLPIEDALRVLDQWLLNIKANPEKSVAQNKPVSAGDRCYDQFKNIIDDQKGTWNGQWNGQPKGLCQKQFPHFRHSRMVAGGSIYDDALACDKISIQEAVNSNMYGDRDMGNYVNKLQVIFPTGVCKISETPNKHVQAMLKKLKIHPHPI